MSETLGSITYWREELMTFRGLMGQKDAWLDGRVPKAASAILYCWLNTNNTTDSDTSLMQATMLEYDRRLAFMIDKMPNDA